MRKGDWIASSSNIGKVVEVYLDNGAVDVCLYDRNGNKVGRESPPEGGPTTFEPWCDLNNWQVIEEPVFPLRKYCDIQDAVKFKGKKT